MWINTCVNVISKTTTTTTQASIPRRAHFFCVCTFSMDPSEQPVTGAAQRRKQRRLRSWWRHDQQSIAPALATSLHHSSRGQRKARAGEEESETKYRAKFRTTPPPQPVLFSLYEQEPGGRRPASLAEPPGPQERVQRHTMEQLAEVAPMVPSLAVPEPQTVDQVVAMVKHVDSVSSLPQCPRSPGHPACLVRFSVSRRRRNSWWKCLSLLPPRRLGPLGGDL